MFSYRKETVIFREKAALVCAIENASLSVAMFDYKAATDLAKSCISFCPFSESGVVRNTAIPKVAVSVIGGKDCTMLRARFSLTQGGSLGAFALIGFAAFGVCKLIISFLPNHVPFGPVFFMPMIGIMLIISVLYAFFRYYSDELWMQLMEAVESEKEE